MTLYAGAASPESLKVTVTGAVGGPDLSTVVSAEATVYYPGGATAVWTFALGASTATSLIITRTFDADAGDVPTAGQHRLAVRLTFPGSVVRRCTPTTFAVSSYP